MKDIQNNVLELLCKDPRTRNSDTWLVLQYLKRYDGYDFGLDFEDVKKITSMESITRARRKIQNTQGLCQPVEIVRAEREEKEEQFRQEYSSQKNTSRLRISPNIPRPHVAGVGPHIPRLEEL